MTTTKTFLLHLSRLLMLSAFVFVFTACSDDDDDTDDVMTEITIAPGASAAADAQTAFIEAERGQTIVFAAGTFDFTTTLSMTEKSDVTIKGAGMGQTILNFSGQTNGGEGVLVTDSENIRFEGLTIIDSQGDALKARDCNTISFVDVATEWSGEPDSDNGAYGLYPVLCQNVYIDGCYAYGASDAGIYVGQSNNVILKNSTAEGNVAGIEIENTTNADVFDNVAEDNTGGILVFELPGLSQKGGFVRVYNNTVDNNNRTNFAPPGNIVGVVPAGTGVMVLTTSDVEIFGNTISENNFAGVLVANYLFVNDNILFEEPTFNPWPTDIYIHDNTHSITPANRNPVQPDLVLGILQILGLYQLEAPNILTDGLFIEDNLDMCIQEADGTTFINVNADDATFQSVTTDVSTHNCQGQTLPAVSFEPA